LTRRKSRPSELATKKTKLLLRLRNMEGQVRGVQQMIEDNRYCLDVAQQLNALIAAACEVALLVIEDYLRVCVAEAVEAQNQETAIKEMMEVLRKTVRQ
jgi:DNA-binding FrmR family transcriptional regulator